MKTLLLATVGVLCVVGVSSYSEDPVQYHIQTDDGSERYFRYQTYDGQYRKEKRLDDGTVIGTYGWVDATGLLRLYDYVADLSGYRIVRKKTLKMAQQPRAPVTEAPVRRNPSRPSSFRTPSRASVRDQPGLSVSVVRTPTPKPSYTLQRTSPIRRPQAPRGTAPTSDSADAPSQGLPLGESGSEAQPDPATVGDPTGNPATHANRGHGGTATKLTSHTTATQASGEAGTLTRRPVRVGSSSPRRRTQSTREHLVQRTGDLLIERTRDLVTERPGDKVTEAPINGPINRRLPEAGTYSINYDLGNQFHKEKILPDGTKVGKHGYVDPLGILRVTYYTTGPNGHQQSQESKWVGTRDPYQE
ncbi:uncharacterized protein LOC119594603 isoform X2 [Penaeus monodon]|uniref:uncharacterized protein LOC119594603 isoform X2 n=1 Tax=Penaeus monodon TaxID=6687 RepID=UPI0018A7C6A6|nr:uncharacterized protein LOC119594603 isoform X2 [Penaeus monodon]XP_037799602.1 uncharacterized protein LOC119594603 isoform X2 [Penaeus monodon]